MKQTKPAYLSLYETLRDEILSGIRPCGSRLPSRRVMARDRGVSPVTVDHSYELLCEEGYTESHPKSGFYVIYREEDGFSLSAQLPKPVSPSPVPPGIRDSFPFPSLARVMRRVLSDYGERILVRPPNTGCPELREALCRYLARNRGIRVQPDQLVIGAGAEYLYGLVVELLGPQRIWGIEAPSYSKIEQVYRARGVQLDFCALGQDGILSEALRNTPASVLHITPFRSFPSGVTASVSKRREYLRWVTSADRFLVEDDYESEFSLLRKPEDTLFAMAKGRNVIYLNTFSRTVSPSLRVGYMVLPRGLLPVFELRLGFYSCTVPAFEQYVLSELLNSGDFERHINRIRRLERTQKTSGGHIT
jgi:GntR family transcriptional regulator/MocR family aminotransferase